ncbi:MAG: hypothetical protein GY847_05770 [Proteobacteria bacterium]|nr:hypothetical protein [Pseudomonadota bacterium]
MNYWLRQIVNLCLESEQKSRTLYLSFNESASGDDEKAFWKEVAADESSHIAHWKKLIEKSRKVYIPNPFTKPKKVIARLEENLRTIDAMGNEVSGTNDTERAIEAALILETFMMNPAFTVLFHLADPKGELEYPSIEYEKHVVRFIQFAKTHLASGSQRFLSLSLENMLAQSEEMAEKIIAMQSLRGLIPICAWCKKIKKDDGYWARLENYIEHHTLAEFSHGVCPDCVDKM